MSQIKIFWDPKGFELDSLGKKECLTPPTDGDKRTWAWHPEYCANIIQSGLGTVEQPTSPQSSR